MSDYLIRRYKKADIPELTKLWVEGFEEDERLLGPFFKALECMGSGIVAELEGEIAGAGYAITGQALVTAEGTVPLGLIYGIAVYPQYRSHGIGRAIVKATAELARAEGAKIVCCEPANQSLVRWYDEVLGLKASLFRQETLIKAEDRLPCRPLSGEEYNMLREEFLRRDDHVSLLQPALDFEEAMLNIYGGGFFSVGNGIATAYLWEEQAIVRELICSADVLEDAAASLAHALAASEARVYFPSERGQAYILSDSPLPPDCIWNLSFN